MYGLLALMPSAPRVLTPSYVLPSLAQANLLVQWDVPGIAVWNGGKFDRNGNAMGHPSGKSTIRKYRLHRNAINALTSQARSSLAGCQADAHPTQTQGALQPEVLPA
jgi:hypothetical protein